jgi:tRNA-dihydrouridine synthase
MIGRGAIRNPWLFNQIRQSRESVVSFVPCGRDILEYIHRLYESVRPPDSRESAQVQKMKKYLNFVGLGVDPEGRFLHEIRRVTTEADFFRVCEEFLEHDRPMTLEPFPITFKETDVLAGQHL